MRPVSIFTMSFNKNEKGIVMMGQGMIGINPPDYRLVDIVNVLYDPNDPQHIYIDSFWDVWMSSAIHLSLGSAFTLTGILINFKGRCEKRLPR